MDPLLQEMMRTLREARQAVQAELELHALSRTADTTPLRRLRRAAGEFADQADFLVLKMHDRDAEGAMIREAEQLCGFFRGTQERIGFMLGAGRG